MQVAELFRISEETQIGEARRRAQVVAESLGFAGTEVGRVALVVSEAAHNQLAHAGGGDIILQAADADGETDAALEILGLDDGPGMVDIGACMRDGYSTAGTQGHGLGALARLSDTFDILSSPGEGTVLLSRICCTPSPSRSTGRRIGAVALPYPGEEVTGDGWAIKVHNQRTVAILVDGLGHGPLAAEAREEAIRVFASDSQLPPEQLLRRAHEALRKTRGAAAAIATIDHAAGTLHYCGAGNVVGYMVGPDGVTNLMSYDGTVGYHVSKFREFVHPWSEEAFLVMHSDGMSGRARPEYLESLARHDPSLIAAVLMRAGRRGRDDTTVLVAKGAAL